MKSFEEYVSIFEKITSKEAQDKINSGEELVVFIGRATCPYCQKFAPKINKVSLEKDEKVYFINSGDNEDEYLQEFRNSYKIPTVPGLLVFKNNEVKVVCDSSLSEEEITEFIK